MARATAEFHTGQRVRVVQRGTLQIGTVTLKDNVFEGVEIVGRNADGSYRVRGIIRTPDTDVVTVPAEWVEPL